MKNLFITILIFMSFICKAQMNDVKCVQAGYYLTGGSYTPNLVQDIPFKLTPSMSSDMVDGITLQGDSAILEENGMYIIDFNAHLLVNAGVEIEIDVYVNSVANNKGILKHTGDNQYQNISWKFCLHNLAIGDNISFRAKNITDSTDPTFQEISIIFTKMHH